MRVFLTVERYFPAIGGAERVVQRIAEGLQRRDHEVVVITSGRRETQSLNGVRVERFPVVGNLARGIRGNTGAVLGMIKADQPDLIFNYAAQTWPTDLCLQALLDDPARPPLVLAPCGFSGLYDPAYSAYFSRLREALPRYEALVFHSDRYQDRIFAQAAGARNDHVIPNGADSPGDGHRQAQLRPRNGDSVVATVSSHVRSKGHGHFARIVRTLRRERPIQGVIVAPRRTGIDAVRGCHPACSLRSVSRQINLVEGRDPAAVPAVLAAADLFLLPSSVECAPLVLLEAMAAGTPWVSYPVGNASELPGGIVAEGPMEMTAVSSKLLADPDSRRELGDAGREAWSRSHRWAGVVDRYEALFKRVVTVSREHARRT